MRTESQNPIFSCYFPRLVIIVIIIIIHISRAHSDTLKLSRSKLRNRYFEILLPKVIDFKSHERDSYLWIFRLVIWTNSHQETCRSNITRQVRCEDYPRIHRSTPLQVAALISRVAKNCQSKGAPECKAARLFVVFKRRRETEETTRISWCETTAHRPSHAEVPAFFPQGSSLSLFLLKRASSRNCAAKSFRWSVTKESFLLKIFRKPTISKFWMKNKPNKTSFPKRLKINFYSRLFLFKAIIDVTNAVVKKKIEK